MAMDAQRIGRRAKEIREERDKRQADLHDEDRDPDEGATAASGPIEDTADRLARLEGVSTMRSPEDMAPLGAEMGTGGGVERYAAESIEELGATLANDMHDAIDRRLDDIRAELGAVDRQPPRGFVYGSLYGAALCLGSLAGALILTRLGRRE